MSEEVKNVEEVVEETMESKDEKNAEAAISKSKQKREARKVEAKAAKRKAAIGRIVEWVIGLAIAGLFIAAIVMGIYTSATVIKPGTDYSGCLTADGFIKGEDLSTVTDIGLEKLSIPSNKAYSDDATIQSDIDSILSQHEELVTDASLEAKMDDKVNIDYVGSIDGVEFEGGNSNGNGANLVLGSKSFIDTFEDQLVGSHPGDNVTVNVTFPEEYSQNPDLAGKPAVFEVVVNGIYVKPELTDDFVKEFCSDKGSTVDELRQYYVDKHYDENIQEYITSYIVDKAEASKVPSAYVKNAATLIYTTDQQMYEYTNSYYSQMLGGPLYSDFNSYTGLSDKEYQKELKNRAKATACETMTYEALYKKMGLSYTEDEYNEVLSTYGNNAVETYGEPFLKQTAMKLAVMNYVKANVVIE